MIEDNWGVLIKPRQVDVQPGSDPARNAKIIIEPLERGFGMTLGNALRRVLMSSLQGAAVTSAKIDGVLHEFTSIPGVREDVTDIVLNLKDVRLRMEVSGPRRLNLESGQAGTVTAGMITCTEGITILNPDHVICHLDEGASLNVELTVDVGKGYISSDEHEFANPPIGLIPVDAIFTPVLRAAYKVESAREGQVLDYDRLILEIDTDGSVKPEDALAYSARILQDQLNTFVNFEEPDVNIKEVVIEQEVTMNPQFLQKVEDLELSVRAANCLKNDNIVYIGDLVLKSEPDMLKTPNFGRKSLNEIKEVLTRMGLGLGMDNPNWPPENIEELAKQHDNF